MKYFNLFLIWATTIWHFGAQAQVKCKGPQAFIVNGSYESGNDCSFYHDLDRAYESLNAFPCKTSFAPSHYEIPDCGGVTSNQKFAGKKEADFVASWENIKREVAKRAKGLNPGEPFLLYFTDHGGSSGEPPETSNVHLGQDVMTVAQQRELVETIHRVKPGTKVITINDHCFGGGMLHSNFKSTGGEIIPNSCGFAPTADNELGFWDDTFITHLSKDGQANRGKRNFFQAYYSFEKRPRLLGSTSISTSDLFLNNYLDNNKGETHFHKLAGQSELSKKMDCLDFESVFRLELKGIDELTQTVFNYVLMPRLSSMKKEIKLYQKKSGVVNPEIAYSELEKLHKKMNSEIDGYAQLEKELQEKQEYIFEEAYSEMTKRFEELENLMMEFEDSEDSEDSDELDEEYDKIEEEYAQLDQKIEQIWENRMEIPAYAENSIKITEAKRNMLRKGLQTVPLNRLMKVVKNANALRLMARNKDFKAFSDFMNILDCEQTSYR